MEANRLSELFLHFMGNIELSDVGCWLWQGQTAGKDYPVIKRWGETIYGHRVMCEWLHGAPTEAKPWALHSCDVHNCVNPNHLRWGTPKENSQDALERSPRFGGVVRRRLTDAQADQVRAGHAKGATLRELATDFGVSVSCVQRIVTRASYRETSA